MAIWQCDLDIVPRGIDTLGDCFAAWSVDKCNEFVAALHELLPERKSWCEDIASLGAEDGNCIDILYTNQRESVDSVLVRITLRDEFRPFVTRLCQVCERFDTTLRANGPDRKLLAPSTEGVLAFLCRSKAAEFVRDPHDLLDRLGRAASGDN